jgi:hypothetical protein
MAISILSLPRDVQIEVQSAIRDQRIIEASQHSRFFSPNGFHSDWAYADHILRTTPITRETVQQTIEEVARSRYMDGFTVDPWMKPIMASIYQDYEPKHVQ